MTTTIRFVIAGLLLVTAILSILLWKRADLALDPTPGGSIKAVVYDYTTASPYYLLSKPEDLTVLKDKEMKELVERFGREDLVTAIKMMPEHIQVQDKFLRYLSKSENLSEPEVKKVEDSRKLHARQWNQLISLLQSATARNLKNELLIKAQEVRIRNPSESESNKAIGSTKADEAQKKMDEENRLERELEKEQSMINQLEAEIIDLEKNDQEVKSEIVKLEKNLANLRE